MRKLIVTTFATLDGVMQAPGGPGEDDDGGFEHEGWSVGYWDERMGRARDGGPPRRRRVSCSAAGHTRSSRGTGRSSATTIRWPRS